MDFDLDSISVDCQSASYLRKHQIANILNWHQFCVSVALWSA